MVKAMETRRIPLGGRRGPVRGFAVVDAADAEAVLGCSWYLDHEGYAMSKTSGEAVRLHRFLMTPGAGLEVDHINGDRLDCRRSNMRIVTHAEQMQNRRTPNGAYRGVYRDARDGVWYGQVKHMGRRHTTVRSRDREAVREAVMALRRELLPFAVER